MAPRINIVEVAVLFMNDIFTCGTFRRKPIRVLENTFTHTRANQQQNNRSVVTEPHRGEYTVSTRRQPWDPSSQIVAVLHAPACGGSCVWELDVT